jgi:hypothetical protein
MLLLVMVAVAVVADVMITIMSLESVFSLHDGTDGEDKRWMDGWMDERDTLIHLLERTASRRDAIDVDDDRGPKMANFFFFVKDDDARRGSSFFHIVPVPQYTGTVRESRAVK